MSIRFRGKVIAGTGSPGVDGIGADGADGADGLDGLNFAIFGSILHLAIPPSDRRIRPLDGGTFEKDGELSKAYEKLEEIKLEYPQLFCTEEEFSATVGTYGECGKFVLGETYVRLPKVVGFIQGLSSIEKLGSIVEAGLPSHTHTRGTMNITGSFSSQDSKASGAFSLGNNIGGLGGGGVTTHYVNFDASKTWTGSTSAPNNDIYGKSSKVQPQAIQYQYYIVLATNIQEVIPIVDEYKAINGYDLFDTKWSDKILENASWLRSNGQWNSGEVYKDAYRLLLESYTSGKEETETVGETIIGFRRALNGMKITTDLTSYTSILGETGTSWYYVIDMERSMFILPQTDGFLQYSNDDVGKYNSAGLPNITGQVGRSLTGAQHEGVTQRTGAFSDSYHSACAGAHSYTDGRYAVHAVFDASKSNSIYGNSETVQPNSVNGYLYFYVGDTLKNLAIIDTGKILEALANKVDKNGTSTDDGSNDNTGTDTPDAPATDATAVTVTETYRNGNDWYIVYSNGYCIQGGKYEGTLSGCAGTLNDKYYTVSLLKRINGASSFFGYAESAYFPAYTFVSTKYPAETVKNYAVWGSIVKNVGDDFLSKLEMYQYFLDTSVASGCTMTNVTWQVHGFLAGTVFVPTT